MKCENVIRNVIEGECEDYFLGVVDLSQIENGIVEKYSSLIAEYPRAISIGITMPYKVVEKLQIEDMAYNETNCQLKYITSHLSSLLEQKGYRALSVPKSKEMNDDSNVSFHEVVANLADMGEIKKNALIIPEVGSKVNWGTILTNAPI